MIQLRFLKPILFLFILFASFHLFYDVVYENHLGEGTDSDVLYPYLFARDLWTGGWTAVRGWNLPPCTTLFPDLVLSILTYPIFTSVDSHLFVFGFFAFCAPFAFARSLGLAKRFSYLVSLGFLLFAGLDPNQLGQFFFPSFHAMTFLFATWTLYELEHWNPKQTKVWIRFLFLMTLVWISEYWYFVNIAPYLCFFAVVRLRRQSVGPLSLCLVGFFAAKGISRGFRLLGIGIIGTNNLNLTTTITSSFSQLFSHPDRIWYGLKLSITNNSLLSEWMYWYLVIGCMYLIFLMIQQKGKDFFVELFLFLSPCLTVVFLYLLQIEPNIRYLYFLPFGVFYFSFRIVERIPLVRFGIPIVIVFGCFLFYLGKHSELMAQIKVGEEKRNQRLECLSEFDPNLPGAATYWPIKYSYAFTEKRWTLVPFTNEGVYYPWVANTSWDGTDKDQTFDSFRWGITESKTNLEIWKDVTLVKECAGWYFFRRN